jgi:hypothetical protein
VRFVVPLPAPADQIDYPNLQANILKIEWDTTSITQEFASGNRCTVTEKDLLASRTRQMEFMSLTICSQELLNRRAHLSHRTRIPRRVIAAGQLAASGRDSDYVDGPSENALSNDLHLLPDHMP